METLRIFKVGGKVIDDKESMQNFLSDFAAVPGFKILVHGGGKIASDMMTSMGIEPKMIDGRRVTDEASLEVVTMVYGGLVNKNIVSVLQSHSCNALGLTGADLDVITANKRPAKPLDFGFAGDIIEVNSITLQKLIHEDIVPVMAPITHDRNGQLLNTNADTIASSVARALSTYFKVELVYCFELDGVLDKERQVIDQLDEEKYEFLKSGDDPVISDGMIPKLDNAFDSLKEGVERVMICHFKSINKIATPSFGGTVICLN
ncbi:MAG: acetylglutamate kinase [Bacteroidota bacterium]